MDLEADVPGCGHGIEDLGSGDAVDPGADGVADGNDADGVPFVWSECASW